MCTNGADAIYCYSTFGPIFGNIKGHDIGINTNSNVFVCVFFFVLEGNVDKLEGTTGGGV